MAASKKCGQIQRLVKYSLSLLQGVLSCLKTKEIQQSARISWHFSSQILSHATLWQQSNAFWDFPCWGAGSKGQPSPPGPLAAHPTATMGVAGGVRQGWDCCLPSHYHQEITLRWIAVHVLLQYSFVNSMPLESTAGLESIQATVL